MDIVKRILFVCIYPICWLISYALFMLWLILFMLPCFLFYIVKTGSVPSADSKTTDITNDVLEFVTEKSHVFLCEKFGIETEK